MACVNAGGAYEGTTEKGWPELTSLQFWAVAAHAILTISRLAIGGLCLRKPRLRMGGSSACQSNTNGYDEAPRGEMSFF